MATQLGHEPSDRTG
jgi:hypothetical protein